MLARWTVSQRAYMRSGQWRTPYILAKPDQGLVVSKIVDAPLKTKWKLHPILSVLPPLTVGQLALAVESVKTYGQKGGIDALDGQIVGGIAEYTACLKAGVAPKVTTIEEPKSLIEYALRRNVPVQQYDANARACIGVLGEEFWKAPGLARMSEGGRKGGKTKKGSVKVNEPFATKKKGIDVWYVLAARVLQVQPSRISRLAKLRGRAQDAFEAVRAGRIQKVTDAFALVDECPTAHERAAVLHEYETKKAEERNTQLLGVIKAHGRRKREPKTAGAPTGKNYTLYSGPMEEHGAKVLDESIDLVFADILYPREDALRMAGPVCDLAARVLRPGGTLAITPGHATVDIVADAAKRAALHPFATGFVLYKGSSPWTNVRRRQPRRRQSRRSARSSPSCAPR